VFKLDNKDIKKLENKLNIRKISYATRNTLNSIAFTTQKHARRNVNRRLTIRNRYTEQSIRVEQTRSLKIRDQFVVIGSVADYMETQEFGGVKKKRGKEGVSIPTSFSAGQGRSKDRTRLPKKPNKLENIRLKKKNKRRLTGRQELLVKVQQAVNTGNKYIFHQFDAGKKGIFKVVGGTKNIKRGWPGNARLEMVWDMTEQIVTIPATPWLRPAVNTASKFLPIAYKKALQFQLNR
jgi:hypothetical protein